AADAFLDLVALGIVADVASQVGDARYLLQLGLEALHNTQRLGLLELFKIANLNPAQLTETSISFALAPRLNALGRLDDANISVEFFTTQDLIRARVLAVQLQGFNMERKRLCDVVFQEAQSQLRINPTLLDYDALVLENPGWHPGVIGIVANRLAELYHRPTVLLSSAEEQVRGSARSVAGCNITAAIAQQQGLLLNFGGHAMAAGVALKKSNIPEFRVQLSQAIREQMVAGTEESPSVMAIDTYLPLEAVSLSLAADLDRLSPFGAGNPQLVFATRDLRITTKKTLGAEETHLKLMVEDAHGMVMPIFWWHWRGADLPEGQFDLAYHIETTTYNGQRQLQLRWLAAQDVETSVVELQKPKTVEIVDYRGVPEPRKLLGPLLEVAGVQVWREGLAIQDVPGQTRYELSGDLAVPLEQGGKVLVVWTLPPGFDEWQAVLERVNPETLYLFDVDPGAQDYQGFLQRLAGLVKHAVRANSGQAQLSVLAAAMAQREPIILTGLSWLEAQGHITIKSHSDDILLFAAGGHKNPGEVQAITRMLREQLAEVAAYRQYFANVDAARLKKS
ncbi:MAG: hypothetical protein JW981_00795, partial [Anaerolineae bacterium]|nr:hypothetical protein [Anaerolineae bacterium]